MKFVCALIACALGVALAADENAERLARAVALTRAHNYKEAAAIMQGVAPPDAIPQRIAFFRLRAAIASGNGDPKAGAEAMESALALAPEDSGVLRATMIAETNAKLYDAAAANVEKLIAGDDSADLEQMLGDIQEQRGDSLAAVRAYQRAVELAPSVADYHLALALELLRHHTFQPAIVVLEPAVQRFPDSLNLRLALGLSYFLVDRNTDAASVLRSALTMQPSSEIAFEYLADIELQPSAVRDDAATSQLCAFSDAHAANGHAKAVCGALFLRTAEQDGTQVNRPEIMNRLHAAVRLAPKDALARGELGKAYEALQQWPGARGELEAWAQLEPDSLDAHYHLARVYRRLGLADLAREQEKLRAQAEQKNVEYTEQRNRAITQFLYTLPKK